MKTFLITLSIILTFGRTSSQRNGQREWTVGDCHETSTAHFVAQQELPSKNLPDDEIRMKHNAAIENDTVVVELEYYGWGCPCPQWITRENKIIYESQNRLEENKTLGLFWNVKPENDSLPNPFDLTDDMENLKFEFKGRFYVKPQFLGDEGEQGPAKTLLYYSVKHLN